MNQPFNQPRPSRYPGLDSRRPENIPFADWAERQLYSSHNEQWARFEGADLVEGCEELLRDSAGVVAGPEAERRERQRRAQVEGWTPGGDPGE